MADPVQQFQEALADRGIVPPAELLADGQLHRCDAEGHGGKGDAAYLLHLDGIPAGGFENWRDGRGWQNWRAGVEHALTPAEESAHKVRIKKAQQAREIEDNKRKSEARKKADFLWSGASMCTQHPYLDRKCITANGARLHRESLVLPMCDTAGTLHSLQFISPDGHKMFLAGGRKRGCYFNIGKPDGVLCIAEGFATGASIHQATGHAVAVAFDAGNLQPVAIALREKFPNVRLFLCADDDYRTDGNPGKARATEAAQAVGGVVVLPDFGTNRPEGATDFNDLFIARGTDAVRQSFEVAMRKPDISVKSCIYGRGRFEYNHRGVFFIGVDDEGKEMRPQSICSPLRVIAKTRDAKSGEWGRLLEWRDDDGVRHQWAMPLELLQGDGYEVRRELSRLGLIISPGKSARDQLSIYLQVWPIETRARCVDRLGWHGSVYVTPAESIGQNDEIVVFQNTHAIEPAFCVAGTAGEWRDSVAALAVGNSRLVFALSVAFASPLTDVVDEDSGGFHLRGSSSSGKTTALKVAASVWGNPNTYPRLWRATANGLEGLAALHNHGLLILDELSQIDPHEAGEAAYLLANERGKARASRNGTARQSASWRLLFMSAGEESLTGLMARAGRKANAGQEIRLADIDADAGAGMGAFEALHNQPTPASLAQALKDATIKNHGAVGLTWLRHIVTDRPRVADFIADGMRQFVEEAAPKDAAGQVIRVARRFAIVAVAGELASHYGLTGWPEGEAINAVRKCFAAWLEAFGGSGNREERAMLSQVRAFFERHGASRFEDVKASYEQHIHNRAGFFRTGKNGEREFLVLPEAFRTEVCQGHDAKMMTKALLECGWIEPGKDGKTTQKPRLPGLGPTRCYVFTVKMWEGDE